VSVRIALVCPYDWDGSGGVQIQVGELARRLRLVGHDVLVLTPARSRPREPWVVAVGRPVSLPYGRTRAPISPWPRTRRRVREVLEAFAPALVHVHEPFAPSASWFAQGLRGVPVVATFHSGIDRSVAYDAAALFMRRIARRLAARIAVSERAAAVARRRLGGTYRVIPNGVDVARFARATPGDLGPGRRILFVGRLHPRKGFPLAVDAFARLAVDRPDLQLIVVGEGAERAAIDRLDPQVRGRVRMLGAVANRDLPEIAVACDAFVAPNTGGESFGVVLIEAMAAGLPVVATRIPGFDEVVTDGVDGILIPPGDLGALVGALAGVLDDAARARSFSAAGRARAARFDWEVVLPELEAVYEGAVQTGPPTLR
jgi:phosphatidylinositol alpha-mannosyltransferase